jgi:cell division protein FtsW (lipid II flippase)
MTALSFRTADGSEHRIPQFLDAPEEADVNAWYRNSGIFLLVVSGVVLQQSIFRLRIWEDGQPGSGFMPLLLGLALAGLSLALVVKHRARDAERRPFWEGGAWRYPLVAVAITAVFIVVFDDIGAMTSVAVLVTGWLWLVSKKSILVSAVTGVVTAAVVWVVFERFLQTPFPRGWLF